MYLGLTAPLKPMLPKPTKTLLTVATPTIGVYAPMLKAKAITFLSMPRVSTTHQPRLSPSMAY